MMFFKKKNILKVKTYGAPVLKKKAAPIAQIDEEVKELASAMIDTMKAFDGIGLAAPQVGISRRMVAFGLPMRPEDSLTPPTPGEIMLLPRMPFVVINPEIIGSSSEIETADEGCLSVPEVYAPVTRPLRVTFRATMVETGETVNVECGGLLARCVQHEIDHLNGVLFVSRLEAEDAAVVKAELQYLKKNGERRGFNRDS
jgi:peptide deformylase